MNRPALLAAAVLFAGTFAPAPSSAADAPAAAVPSTQPDAKTDKAVTAWVDSLGLNDPAKAARVKALILTHLTAVRDWHNAHPASTVPDGIDLSSGKKMNDPQRQLIADSAMPKTAHETLMAGLHQELSDEQVEAVLDKYTEGKVAFTMKGYKAVIPDLKPDEEAEILKNLKAAREQAIDFKGSKPISAIFKIYKVKNELYLYQHGRNWSALYKEYVDGVRSGKASSTQPAVKVEE